LRTYQTIAKQIAANVLPGMAPYPKVPLTAHPKKPAEANNAVGTMRSLMTRLPFALMMILTFDMRA
jgi:hypothetical protein